MQSSGPAHKIQQSKVTKMHNKITKAGDHKLDGFTNLWQRLFSPIRIDGAVDVAGLAGFRAGNGPHM